MKKIVSLLLVMVMLLALAACTPAEPTATAPTNPVPTTPAPTDPKPTEPAPTDPQPSVNVMTHAEYMAAEDGTAVVVEFFVQATQSWWDNKITIYGQTPEGGYFGYEVACTQEEAAKLVPGTKVRLTGERGSWAGEIEVMNATLEILEGETWIAEPVDVTVLLSTEELINHQNKLVVFKGMTVEAIAYKNNEPGDDIYVTLSRNGVSYSFCVERYLTGPETEVYQAVQALEVGDVITVEGFLYWYEDVNTHITAVTAYTNAHEAYLAAEDGTAVSVEFYVQATQSWWDNKITIYGQTAEGGYFAYEVACSEDEAAKLVPGTLIRITGDRGSWAGEIEVMNGTIEFLDGINWIAPATDVTALLGTEELVKHQNEKVAFKGLTIEAISYKNGEPGDDIYVTVSYNGASYDFCVERYLTGPDTDVYKAFAELQAGDVVDIEGFLYWYEAVNTHITSVTKAA